MPPYWVSDSDVNVGSLQMYLDVDVGPIEEYRKVQNS